MALPPIVNPNNPILNFPQPPLAQAPVIRNETGITGAKVLLLVTALLAVQGGIRAHDDSDLCNSLRKEENDALAEYSEDNESHWRTSQDWTDEFHKEHDATENANRALARKTLCLESGQKINPQYNCNPHIEQHNEAVASMNKAKIAFKDTQAKNEKAKLKSSNSWNNYKSKRDKRVSYYCGRIN